MAATESTIQTVKDMERYKYGFETEIESTVRPKV